MRIFLHRHIFHPIDAVIFIIILWSVLLHPLPGSGCFSPNGLKRCGRRKTANKLLPHGWPQHSNQSPSVPQPVAARFLRTPKHYLLPSRCATFALDIIQIFRVIAYRHHLVINFSISLRSKSSFRHIIIGNRTSFRYYR